MKVVFAGPSLYGTTPDLGDIVLRGPVEQGDLEAAVSEGATIVGIVDGHYQQVGSVWHKEILDALSQGVQVFGAASMGALRAAECQAYGMVPVGEIAWSYCHGQRVDDADVALVTGPRELGYVPLSEPMVDIEATVASMLSLGLITAMTASRILRSACDLFFAERSVTALFAHPLLASEDPGLRRSYERHRVSAKRDDALELIDLVRELRAERVARPAWRLANSPFWRDRANGRKVMTLS